MRVQDRSKIIGRIKGKASAKKECGRGEALTGLGRVEEKYWNGNAFARPDGQSHAKKLKLRFRVREIVETVISCRRPGSTRKKKGVYQ